MNKLLSSLDEAAALVEDGDTITISGAFFEQVPMALIRTIIRQGVKDLSLVVAAHGIAVDLLISAGCVKTVTGAYIGFEGYGLAPNFRRAVEEGRLEFRESACFAVASAIKAAALGIPFMPLRGLFGSDLEQLHKEFRTFQWDDEEVLLVPAIKPDVCLVHAHRADTEGNVQTKGSSWDDTLAEAADRVIVTVEEVVSTEEIRQTPELTKIPGFITTAVVEVPDGAHPTGCPFVYDFDEPHVKQYLEMGKTDEGFRKYLEEYVYEAKTHDVYLQKVGRSVRT